MRYKSNLLILALLVSTGFSRSAFAQENWASWSHSISIKGYEGHLFRLQAQVKAAMTSDPKISALTKDIQIAKGKKVFMQTCFVCHQMNGEGIANQIPPLAKSDYLMADTERAIRIVLQGQTGEIEVNGKKYNGTMLPLNNLTDEEVSNVLTYVRNSFGNTGEAVQPEAVRRVRSETPPPAANQYE